MTECLHQCYEGFTSPFYPQPFLQNRAIWLHRAKHSFTQAHMKHSFQLTMKQRKKVVISSSFIFQCHFLGHTQTLRKHWFLLITMPGLRRTDTWAEPVDILQGTSPNICFRRIKSGKAPAIEKQNAHLKLQLLKLLLEHNRQMFLSFLLPPAWWRPENTFPEVSTSVTEAISEKMYFKNTPNLSF